jgi:hypothetical protein
LGAQRERWLPLAAAAVILALLGAALLLGRPGPVQESQEIVLTERTTDTGLATLDTDRDQLSDLEELTSGTNPAANDTDADGLGDLWEVRHEGLDPLSNTFCPDPARSDAARDCDDDGLSNVEEFAAGTDPGIADQDADALPDGLEVACGSDPFVADASKDPDKDGLDNLAELDAGTRCDREDSDLDGLTDPEELNLTHTNPTRTSTGGSGLADGWLQTFHLPLDDAAAGFQDADGDALTNLEEYQVTVQLASKQANGTLQGRALLEVFLRGLDPFKNDTDGDAMSDAYEVRYGLDPLDAGLADTSVGPEGDPDRDGLPNKLEATANSNPFLGDTDGDTLTDLEEVTQGWVVKVEDKVRNVTSDPSRADSDGDGLSDLEEKQGRAVRQAVEHVFPALDPRSPDTDLDALGDLQEITLAITSPTEPRRLDPTDPDSDGDGLLDGDEYRFWGQRQQGQGPEFEALLDRLQKQLAAALPGQAVGREQAAAALAPGGDADGDGKPNLLDGDSDGDAIDDGKELVPEEKAIAPGSRIRRTLPATDPALADSDGEGLPDAWENEFATYDFTLGDWNLNASSRDSLRRNDGKTDADRDLDRDGVDYNGTRYAHPVKYEHSNLFEYLGGTHPNLVDSDLDGLSDGWETYFTCVAAAAPKRICGPLQRSEDAKGTIDLDPSKLDADGDGVADGDEVAQAVAYVRFVRPASTESLDDVAATLDHARGETFARTVNQGPSDLVNDLFGGADHPAVVRIHGEYRLNFSNAFGKSLDVAVGDSDGDTMPDALELAKALNPLEPADARNDNDLDTLTNAEEVAKGTDVALVVCELSKPATADTDCGGLTDDEDANPLYPQDDAPLGDTDCDGVKNQDEGTLGTSLAGADSDGDGLLDGPSVAFFETSEEFEGAKPIVVRASRVILTEGCAGSVSLGELEARFRGLAIAQAVTSSGSTFLGENAFASKGTDADTDLDGMPDGWEAYWVEAHGAAGATDPINPGFFNDGDALNNTAEYEAGKPAGWEARSCGVWWLGSDPRAGDTDGDGTLDGAIVGGEALGVDFDADNDGLDDFNGEDPVLFDPANVGAQPLASCGAYADFVDNWVFRGARKASPDRNHDGVPDRLDYARTKFTELKANLDPDGVLPEDERGSNLLKGARFTVQGRVVVDEAGSASGRGVGGMVVVVNLGQGAGDRSGQPEDVLGVALTGSDGRFEVQGAIAKARNVTLASSAVVFSATHAAGELLAWSPDTAKIPPGVGYRLLVSTLSRQEGPDGPYNISAQANGTSFLARGAKGSLVVSAPGGADLDLPLLTLKSGSQLSLRGPLATIAGERLKGKGTATDSLGDPLPKSSLENGLLRATWEGQTYRARPEVAVSDGAFDLDLPTTSTTSLGLHNLSIEYVGDSILVSGARLNATAEVRYPTNISGRPLNEGLLAIAGEVLRVEGQAVDFHGTPLPPGLPVEARLAGARFPGNTTDEGKFTIEGLVPTTASVGTQVVEVAFLGGSGYEPSRAEAGLVTLLQRTVLTIATARSPLGRDLVITGTLVDLAGNPVDDPTEEGNTSLLVVTPVAQGLVNVTGTEWRFTIPRAQLPGAGSLQVRADFGGTLLYKGSNAAREVQLTSRTTLKLLTDPVPRGLPGAVKGRLLDEQGAGAAGEIVLVSFGNLTGAAATDAQGNFTFPVLLPPDAPLGGLVAEARYGGGRGGLLEAAEPVSAVLQVVAPSQLTLDDYTGPLGALPARGRLLDDTGEGVAGAKLQLTLEGKALGFAVSDLEGRFDTELPLPDGVEAGLHTARARFGGTGTLAASEADATYHLLTDSRLTIQRVDPLVRGVEALVLAKLTDAAGKPLAGRQLELRIAGAVVGHGLTDAGGLAPLRGKPPSLLEPGNVTLAVRFTGDEGHTGAVASQDLPLTTRTDLTVDLPGEVEQGQVFRGTILLSDDAGRPLAGQIVVVNFSRFAYPLTLTTDAEGRANFTGRIEGPGVGTLSVRYPGGEGRAAAERTIQVQSRVPILAGTGPLGLLALAAAVIIVGSVLAAKRLRRVQVAEVEGILREVGERLFASTEYQASILWAYQRLVEHVRGRGFLVKESFTPREFVDALAHAIPAGKPSLERLAGVFEEARYSPHPIGPRQRDEALAALRAIERDLRGMPPQAKLEVVRPG